MSTTSQGFTAIQAFDYRPGITTREALSDNPAVRGHALSINQGFPYPATSAAFHHGHQGEMRQHIQRNTGGDLTRREREVLRLVASGATDQSIADALYIARRTVTTHVAAILKKLDARNRTAAATLAIRHDLI